MAALEERCYFELGITELRALLEHGYLFPICQEQKIADATSPFLG
jgi:hypothetical protein